MPGSTRKKVLLAKIESTQGTDASPTSVDAVLCEDPLFTPDVNIINTNEVTGSLDSSPPIVGGIKGKVTFSVYLKGSGTAGTAPQFGKLLRACGFAETITASAVPASPAALQAGGSGTSAVLGTAAGTASNAYLGMPVIFSSASAGGVNGTAFVADYTTGRVASLTDSFGTSTLVATSNYQIPVNVAYTPSSASAPGLTIYLYEDMGGGNGKVRKLLGCIGSVTLSVDAGGVGKLNFTFMGMYAGESDASLPTGMTYEATRPPVWRSGKMLMNRVAAAVKTLSSDVGNTTPMPDDPNQTEGFNVPLITVRNITGSVDPLDVLVATNDVMSAFRNGTTHILHARWGSTSGNMLGITYPSSLYTGNNPAERENLNARAYPFEANGVDSGMVITCW